MRKIIGTLLVLILYSCANNMNKEAMIADEEAVRIEDVMKSRNFTLEELTSKKLQGYFELLKLKNEHSEFREDILEQLKGFSEKEFIKMNSSDDFTIENIRKVGTDITLSDSVQKMRLQYDFRTGNQIKTDSVIALIKTKTILLDGVPTKSTKITFSLVE